MMDLYTEVLTTTNFDDKERFLQMVLETKAGMEARIVGGGHSVAAGRLDAMDSTAGYANELMGGVSYLQYLKQLTLRVEADWAGVKAELEAIRAAVLSRKGALVNVTADERTMTAADAAVSRFLESMPAVGGSVQPWAEVLAPGNEGLVVPTQVNYVAKGANLYKAGYELQGSAYVISKYLGTTWLWDRVRVSGGAYGGFCDFDSHSGMFTYLSYRDPNLLGTLDNYDGTGDFLRSLEMDKEELSNAIIGCVGDIDAYQLPDAKGYQSLMRYLLKVEDSERQERREQILGTTVADFKAFADSLEAVKTSGQIVAVASADAVAKANAKRPGLLTVRNIL
jgi:Zn-dependent M16 (insulinase) family peptidase